MVLTTNNKNRNFIFFIFSCFVLSAFFPYIQILPFPTDLQPNTMLIGLGLIMLLLNQPSNHKIPVKIVYLIIPILVSFLLIISYGITGNSIRSFGAYISVFIISLSTFLVFRQGYEFKLKKLYYIIFIWGAVGAIQFLVNKGFLSFLVSRFAFYDSQGYGERGVSALSNEPSFYGSICFFLWLFFLLHKDFNNVAKNTKIAVFVALIGQTILFASSSVSLIYFVILGFVYFIIHVNKILLSVLLLLLFVSKTTGLDENLLGLVEVVIGKNRIYSILEIVIESKEQLIFLDPSINERFFNIYISVLGSIESFLIPNGFDSFAGYKQDLMNSELSSLYWWTTEKHTRIQSGYGAILYELGVFGVMIPAVFNYFLYHYFCFNKKKFWTIAISVNIVMFSTIPISFPLYSFFIGYLAYYGGNKYYQSKELKS